MEEFMACIQYARNTIRCIEMEYGIGSFQPQRCWNYVVGTVLLKDSRRHSPEGHSCLHIRCFATLAFRASVAIAVVIKAPFPIPIVIPGDIRTEGERTADHARSVLVYTEVAVGVITEVWRLIVHHAFPNVAVV